MDVGGDRRHISSLRHDHRLTNGVDAASLIDNERLTARMAMLNRASAGRWEIAE